MTAFRRALDWVRHALCWLGWHSYRTKRLVEHDWGGGYVFKHDGEVCHRCGRVKDLWAAYVALSILEKQKEYGQDK